MGRRLLFFIIGILILNASVQAQNTGSISGSLMMLDRKTPHVAVPTQIMMNGKVVRTILSDDFGKYVFDNLEPGNYKIRCKVPGNAYPESPGLVKVNGGQAVTGIGLYFPPIKRGAWKHYKAIDGLAFNSVTDIYEDKSGNLWFATETGISRFDGKTFTNLTADDGLVDISVRCIYGDSEGNMWFGTWNGLSRYDVRGMGDSPHFTNFSKENGLPSNSISAITQTPDGAMWFCTDNGISRYNGKEFTNFDVKDGLAHNEVNDVYLDGNEVLWFATSGGVSRYHNGKFTNLTQKDGLPYDSITVIHQTPDGRFWFGIYGGGISIYDGSSFANIGKGDGLISDFVRDIKSDKDGVVWIAAWQGASRYDGETFVNFTTDDGIPSKYMNCVYIDGNGVVWIGSGALTEYEPGGVSRYDEKSFEIMGKGYGLGDFVNHILPEPDGTMWIGTLHTGAFRYSDEKLDNFSSKDGLGYEAQSWINSITRSPDGKIWFATIYGGAYYYDGKKFTNIKLDKIENVGWGANLVTEVLWVSDKEIWFSTTLAGVYRYDGKNFRRFTVKDRMISDNVLCMDRGPDGAIWFGTISYRSDAGGGLCRYDGKSFTNFTTKDGLPDNNIAEIYFDPDGILWVGTFSGVSRYDGKSFTNFNVTNGLPNNLIMNILRDSEGRMWFGTGGGGACYYNGIWTSLDMRDGLSGNMVTAVAQDKEGRIWFGTENGVTIYRPETSKPEVRIASVTIDKTYNDISSIPDIISGTRVTIGYDSNDFKTIPEKRQYRYRIKEISQDWGPVVKETSFEHSFSKAGTYTFEVQTIDRDLNYSEPVSLELNIVPPFYKKAAFLLPVLLGTGILLIITFISSTAYYRRRRQIRAYQQMAVAELKDARALQISLLPSSAPTIEGIQIAGRSIPANTVGGDFFDYLKLPDGNTGIVIADISGKGLRGAMNAVMTSGMMYEVVKTEDTSGGILSALNNGLQPRMAKNTFVAFLMAVLDTKTYSVSWANGGQPAPLIKGIDGVSEASGDGNLPLGMAPGITYHDNVYQLGSGDMMVFYSDGIIEAENPAEEMFGLERLMKALEDIDMATSPDDAMESILGDVTRFIGNAARYDDMTIVVLKKL